MAARGRHSADCDGLDDRDSCLGCADLPEPYFSEDGCTVYHGDSREILPLIGHADMILTDPPYGILAVGGSAATRRSGGNRDNGRIEWDIALTQKEVESLVNSGHEVFIWGGPHLPLPPTFGYLIWDKQIDGLNFGEAEVCWTTSKFAPRIFRYRAVGVDGGKIHPTQKPVALMKWCLGFSGTGGVVVDPFMGSGTTLVAAKWLGRKAIGIEIEEKYCEIAVDRLRQKVLPLESDNG